ncbi:unnamed protein product [Merluccius merluccius]
MQGLDPNGKTRAIPFPMNPSPSITSSRRPHLSPPLPGLKTFGPNRFQHHPLMTPGSRLHSPRPGHLRSPRPGHLRSSGRVTSTSAPPGSPLLTAASASHSSDSLTWQRAAATGGPGP